MHICPAVHVQSVRHFPQEDPVGLEWTWVGEPTAFFRAFTEPKKENNGIPHMTITFLIALKRLVVWSFVVAQNFSWPFDSTFDPDYEVLIGDVCIIGGGAPDTCAAIRLHDLGKKVIVVEQRDTLGGHMHSHGDYENRTKNRLRGRRPGCY